MKNLNTNVVFLVLLLTSGNPVVLGNGQPAALLLAQNGEPSAEFYEQYIYQRDLNECAVTLLAEQARNGGLAMDTKSGHGMAVDDILEECRKSLGTLKDHQP